MTYGVDVTIIHMYVYIYMSNMHALYNIYNKLRKTEPLTYVIYDNAEY